MTALTKKQRSLNAKECWRTSKILRAKMTAETKKKYFGKKGGKKASGKKAKKRTTKKR